MRKIVDEQIKKAENSFNNKKYFLTLQTYTSITGYPDKYFNYEQNESNIEN